MTLFAILLLPTLASFFNVFFIPESNGKFISGTKNVRRAESFLISARIFSRF